MYLLDSCFRVYVLVVAVVLGHPPRLLNLHSGLLLHIYIFAILCTPDLANTCACDEGSVVCDCVCLSVSVCLLITTVSPTKPDERVEVPFVVAMALGGRSQRNHAFGGARIPPPPTGMGTVECHTWACPEFPAVDILNRIRYRGNEHDVASGYHNCINLFIVRVVNNRHSYKDAIRSHGKDLNATLSAAESRCSI